MKKEEIEEKMSIRHSFILLFSCFFIAFGEGFAVRKSKIGTAEGSRKANRKSIRGTEGEEEGV